MQSIVDQNGLHGLLGERSRLPDHSALITTFYTAYSDNVGQLSSAGQETRRQKFKVRTVPDDFIDSELARVAIINCISRIECCRDSQSDIDGIYSDLCESIIAEMDMKLPKYQAPSTNKRHKIKKPYWNYTLSDLWNSLCKKEQEFLKCNGNYRVKTALRRDYMTARDLFDKTLRQTERSYKRTKAIEKETMTTNNPNEFWEKINKIGPRGDNTIPCEIIDDNGNVVRNEREVLDKWKRDFENLYNGTDNSEFDRLSVHYHQSKVHKLLIENNMNDPLYTSNILLNGNITFEEISKLVMNAKSRSACGFDEIPYFVLKCPPVIAILKELFQLIFDTGIIPTIWRKSIICPILKDASSDKRVPMNYRGISLLSCVSKLYTGFINKRLCPYLDENEILEDEQNEFRRNRSCEDHVFTLNGIIRNNSTVFTAFIDLRKCFDFIDIDMMLYKLLLNGIDGKLYTSIRNIYQQSSACVRVNNKLTDWCTCTTGVKQGDSASPAIISIFANDLVKEVNELGLGFDLDGRKLSTLLYADDIVCIAKTEEDLQRILDKLRDLCRRWRVLINTDKSKCIHFRRGRASATEKSFKIGDNVLELVDSYKYLCVMFHCKGDFTQNDDILSKSAGRALGKVIPRSLKEFGCKTFEKLYDSCVVPIMDYCSSVWGYRKFQCIDNVQHRAIRCYLGVHRFAPILAITGDMGWIPSNYRRWTNMIRY
ncbi:uncharacterized protein LOC128549356 [Mercenaria mercenaria]|uniref:uncharacterized protein LOC128549356 n=1 Tax=Mercenaria mercenaria TaxID=6596 RepID=UPI00234E8E1A|nr:uncharacterized protein LOC128549356 [Mercenaria mercenaria]